MKQLIAGIVLIVVVGLGGFLYRNILERNAVPQPEPACTLEAKVCPDGSSVGRTGPSCTFSPCPSPNVEIPELSVAFVLPEGYVQTETGAANQETQRIYAKPGAGEDAPHLITVKRYVIPEGKTAADVLLSTVRKEPSDMAPESMDEFGELTLGTHTFRTLGIERFEGQVETAFYLIREHDILAFSILERDVLSWTDPELDVMSLPEHAAMRQMLATLQAGS